MRQSVKILGVLFIVYSVLGLWYRFVAVGLFAMTGLHWLRHTDLFPIPGLHLFALGFLNLFFWLAAAFLFILGVVAGVRLLKFRPWARVLGLVLSCLLLLKFPLGTALGIYGLVVLLSGAGARAFASPQPQKA